MYGTISFSARNSSPDAGSWKRVVASRSPGGAEMWYYKQLFLMERGGGAEFGGPKKILKKFVRVAHNNNRTKDYLHMDLFASSLGQRSLKYKGSILWNSLPDEFKSITSITSFDDKIITILLYEYKG